MSDKRRTPENQTGADDQALGKALGSAIRGRVDTPAVRPPVSSIAERATARAKARNTRRAVVGIAASAALVVGGIEAWNALEGDQPSEVIVVDEPTAFPVPEPGTEPTPAPAMESPSEPEDASQTNSQGNPEPATPESFSTGPMLEWTEFDPAVVFGPDRTYVDGIESVGDGRVIVKTGNSDGNQALISANGEDWTVVSTPAGLHIEHFDIAGDRWLVTGWPSPQIGGSIGQAHFSDDYGNTWTEVVIPLGPAGQNETVSVAEAAVAGENMVVAAISRTSPDIAALIVARGLVPDRGSIQGWMSLEGNTVSFTRNELSDPESFELIPEEEALLYRSDRSFVRLFHSDGGDAELVAEYQGLNVAGYGAADGFHLFMLADEGALKLASHDGRQWSQTPLSTGYGALVDRLSNHYDYSNQTIWTSGGTASDYRVERLDGVYTAPLAAELPEGIAHVKRFSVGPAGIAMVALPGSFPNADLELSLQVVKDGYELRYNQPEGGFSLWDLAGSTAIYEFDPESEQANMLPEGIQVVNEGDGARELLVFEDPETGEHLVSFTRKELEPWAQVESLLAAPDITPRQVEAWVGWSPHGAGWMWQTLSAAFDLSDLAEEERDLTEVDLAVGQDFVIARVRAYEVDTSYVAGDEGSDSSVALTPRPSRWFIARAGR